jgi:hypothetical protein
MTATIIVFLVSLILILMGVVTLLDAGHYT